MDSTEDMAPPLAPENGNMPARRGAVPVDNFDAALDYLRQKINSRNSKDGRAGGGPVTIAAPETLDEDRLDHPTFDRRKFSEPPRFPGEQPRLPGEPRTSGDFMPFKEGDLPTPTGRSPEPATFGRGRSYQPTMNGSAVVEEPDGDPSKPDKNILEGGAIFAKDEVPGLEQIPPNERPFATKLWNGLKATAIAQKENLTHIRGREAEWYIGVGAGAAVSLSIQAATGGNPLVSSAAKFALNGAVGIGTTAVLERGYIRDRANITDKYTGQELATKIHELEARHQKSKDRVHNFMLGMAAGATYTSVVGLGLNLAGVHLDELVQSGLKHALELNNTPEPMYVNINSLPSSIEAHATATSIPVAESVAVPTLEPTAVPTLEPAAVPTIALPADMQIPDLANPDAVVHTAAGSGAGLTEAAAATHNIVTHVAGSGAGLHEAATSNLSAEVLGTHQAFSEMVAPHVGEHLNMTTQAVNDALTAQGIDPSQVSAESFEQMRLAAQHQLEAYGNESFSQAVRESVANGNIDLTQAADRGTQLFNESLTASDHHEKLVQAAHDALTQHLNADSQVHGAVQQAVEKLSPTDATPHLINSSETFSHMASEAGHPLTYQAIPVDADYVGAHALANYDKISNFQNQVVQAVGAGDSYHVLFSYSEAPGIIEAARNGNQEAMNKLIAFWRYWPAGDSITQLSDSGVNDILQAAGVSR